MADRLATGIDVLDRRLGGGIPAGSVVLFSADPASQAELLLYELTAARPTLYLTTLRSEGSVTDALAATNARVGDPTVRDVSGDAPLDRANKLVGTLPEGANLVVDVLDPLEHAERGRYRRFLAELGTAMVNTGSVAFLHAMKGDHEPACRAMSEHVADVVWDLETRVSGTDVENHLAVPKFRGGRALDETVKLRLEESVTIDTSRDIA
ncbi:RAD55 family ATPase [Candidatus Halobonum tyrrellensis]|uniref:Recombinase A n=1 Tax=Candidatus Halobonum tyrrellensis G22 TaxID=1324957 RepID=V4GVG7_9EURY|nr:recombinase A [Candidatus Halobonum tyrrellensis]ESP89156.1 recombinase A [Candidatus Halobonum tyrrellensis G22]